MGDPVLLHESKITRDGSCLSSWALYRAQLSSRLNALR